MDQLICFRHPYYTSDKKPNLQCSTCCKMFVTAIKEENFQRKFRATGDKKKLEYMPKFKVSNYCPISI